MGVLLYNKWYNQITKNCFLQRYFIFLIFLLERNVNGMDSELKTFEESHIRSIWDEEKEEWYFSVIDVVAVLTDSKNPRDYW